MKKLLCLLLAVTMLLTACKQEEEATLSVEEVPAEITQKEEITEEESHLLWTSGVAPIEYEIDWTVEGNVIQEHIFTISSSVIFTPVSIFSLNSSPMRYEKFCVSKI